MPLLQPSFRGRLRLFFAVIVIVPMIAVGAVLFRLLDAGDNFKLDSRLTQASTGARNLYAQRREEARSALTKIQADVPLATAIRERKPAVAQQRLNTLAGEIGVDRIELMVYHLGT